MNAAISCPCISTNRNVSSQKILVCYHVTPSACCRLHQPPAQAGIDAAHTPAQLALGRCCDGGWVLDVYRMLLFMPPCHFETLAGHVRNRPQLFQPLPCFLSWKLSISRTRSKHPFIRQSHYQNASSVFSQVSCDTSDTAFEKNCHTGSLACGGFPQSHSRRCSNPPARGKMAPTRSSVAYLAFYVYWSQHHAVSE